MIIAQEKRKQNIVEYLLYMFQVEDTIRACRFDMAVLDEKVISQFRQTESQQLEVRDWYANIMVMMHEEGVQQVGHISIIKTIVNELNDLHLKLLQGGEESDYVAQYKLTKPNIDGFSAKLGREPINEIDTCLNAMYALLLLKLQKKAITGETMEAMQTFSKLLALLAEAYKQIETGKAEI